MKPLNPCLFFSVGLLIILCWPHSFYGGVITLKSGEEISGLIVKKTDEYITMRVNGELAIYKRSDVLRIKGKKPTVPSALSTTLEGKLLSFNDGLQTAAQGSFLHAEEIFKRLLEKNPLDINAQEALRAINDFRNGIISQEYARCLFQGAYYFFNQDYEDAITVYEKALTMDPDAGEIYYNLASSYHALGKERKAITYFEKLAELSPEDLDVLFNLGFIYYSLEEYRKAVPYFEKLLHLFPDDSQSYAFLGTSYYVLGQESKAKEYLKKAKALFEDEGSLDDAREISAMLKDLP